MAGIDPRLTHEQVTIDRYQYIRLIANHHVDPKNNEDVDITVDVKDFKSADCKTLSVAVTLDKRFYEILIFEKDTKGKVINRYVCAEDTPEYTPRDSPINHKRDTVTLHLKKKKDQPWIDYCKQAYGS